VDVRAGRLRATEATPVDANSIFEIGSVTKVFTATLLTDMAEQGLVRVDDPVPRHLPDDVRVPTYGRPITLCDPATQTSGLPRLPQGSSDDRCGSATTRTRASASKTSSTRLRRRC